MPTITEEDLLKETGRLLQESKQLREQVATHWQIKPEQWQKTLADSADAVKQYTRWSVTGPAVEQMTKRPLPGDNSWKAAKQVRAPTGCSHRLRRAFGTTCHFFLSSLPLSQSCGEHQKHAKDT